MLLRTVEQMLAELQYDVRASCYRLQALIDMCDKLLAVCVLQRINAG